MSDLALNGKGFFQVRDEFGEEYYTRTGDFILDQEGFMTTPTGMNLMGYQYDEATDSVQIAAGTVPAMFCRALPLRGLYRTRVISLE